MRQARNIYIHKPRKTLSRKQRRSTLPSKETSSTAKLLIAFFTLILSSFLFWQRNFKIERVIQVFYPQGAQESSSEETSWADSPENISRHTIEKGDIPADIFMQHGKLKSNEVTTLLAASAGIYDFSNLRIGKNIDFIFNEAEKVQLQQINYYPTSERMVVAEVDGESFHVEKKDIPYAVTEKNVSITIDEYLYKDALDEGLTAATIVELADIFSFDVDFTTEIREGDELKLIYQKRTLDGETAPDGKVLAAKFTNQGESHFAYYFEENGDGSHYDAEGKELTRQFLRAPLSYRRITSGYTGARRHPITKKVTAHYQIDYAAPIGTPVVATARGTITSAGWAGGWGNMVRLRHDNGYTTHYGHLSGYGEGVKTGSSISQGQVVGYVGSTGWSTGPHLDYGMKLNGSPVNPMSLKLPKGKPLESSLLEKFEKQKGSWKLN